MFRVRQIRLAIHELKLAEIKLRSKLNLNSQPFL